MPKTITLVSCVKTKRQQPAPAGELYTSTWFGLAREFAQRQGPWMILSAKHGLLDPSEVIEPYEESLNTKGRDQRRAWAKGVVTEILKRTNPGDTIVFLAGVRYRENLLSELQDAGRITEIPMYGLRSGEQLQWMGRQRDESGQSPKCTVTEHSSTKPPEQVQGESRHPSRETRLQDLRRFYETLDLLRRALNGGKLLGESSRADGWPHRGVYFFFEPGENRTDSGQGLRVVRVGTHAVSAGSKSTLWGRLNQHRGTQAGGGNHRGSVFRKLVGSSLAQREPDLAVDSWGQGNSASGEVLGQERDLELRVSQILGAMPLLWLDIGDEPSKSSLRSYIERNSIALLSNFECSEPMDRSSESWLGLHCPKVKIRESDLWNSNHVDENYDPAFLQVLAQLVHLQISSKPSPEVTATMPAPAVTVTKEASVNPAPSRPTTKKHHEDSGSKKSHYQLIAAHLRECDDDALTANIDEIDRWTGGRLPESARKHNAWWSGDRAVWQADGWSASPKVAEQTVTFRRPQ